MYNNYFSSNNVKNTNENVIKVNVTCEQVNEEGKWCDSTSTHIPAAFSTEPISWHIFLISSVSAGVILALMIHTTTTCTGAMRGGRTSPLSSPFTMTITPMDRVVRPHEFCHSYDLSLLLPPSAGQVSNNTSQGQRIILVHIRSARSENDVAMVYMHPIVGQVMCDTLITNVEHLDKILPKTMGGGALPEKSWVSTKGNLVVTKASSMSRWEISTPDKHSIRNPN